MKTYSSVNAERVGLGGELHMLSVQTNKAAGASKKPADADNRL